MTDAYGTLFGTIWLLFGATIMAYHSIIEPIELTNVTVVLVVIFTTASILYQVE